MVTKDGVSTKLYDLSALRILSFLAGGVDSKDQYLYFSAVSSTGYALYRLDMTAKSLTKLNQSSGLKAPYEGKISNVQMVVTAIYPDSTGNLYLGIGKGNGNTPALNSVPDAIAVFSVADSSVHYIYKNLNYGITYSGMPGVIFLPNSTSIRVLPDEHILYSIGNYNSVTSLPGIMEYNMNIGVLLQDVEPPVVGSYDYNSFLPFRDVIAPFSGLKSNLHVAFGYLPMPGRRLQILLQNTWWTVFDFANKRTYAYATGNFQQGASTVYSFGSTDYLLNYDEEGNLYMTSNGVTYFIKTQAL